jgi:hypothetical protein
MKPSFIASFLSFLRTTTIWLSEPIVVVIFSFIAICFGTLGFMRDGFDFGEGAYRTVSFFVIQGFGDSKAGVNWMVETGRWLAVFVIITTAIRTVYALTRDYWQRSQLYFLRNHIVVCGLGEKGYLITEDTRKLGKEVIVIERDTTNPLLEHVRDSGVITIIGDAADTSVLEQARLAFAESVYIASGDDAANAEIASQVYRITTMTKDSRHALSRLSGDIPCFVHVIDPVIGALIKSHEMYTRSDDILELRLFNVYERGARYVMDHYAPDMYQPISADSDTSPHILIVGFHNIGQSILRQCALTGHYANGKNISATIIERNVNDIAHRFMYHYPAVEEFVECDWIRIEPTLLDMQMIVAEHQSTPFGVVYVALQDLTHSMYMAQRINDALNGEVDIILCMESSSRAKLFYQQITHPRIHVVNFLQTSDYASSLLHEPIDALAMQLFMAQSEPLAEDDNTSQSSRYSITEAMRTTWHILDKDMKESYRNSALHIAVIKRTIEHTATAQQNDIIARMEHRRTNAQLRLSGWKYGQEIDSTRKEHPHLMAFDTLPQTVQNRFYMASQQLLAHKAQQTL